MKFTAISGRAWLALIAGCLLIAAQACTSSPSTPTTPSASPTPSTSLTPTITPSSTPTSSTATFQTLASAGQPVYMSTCAVCHGNNGQGSQTCPVVMWGSGSTLGTYNGATLFTDAKGMLNFMSTSMPLTAPATLSHQQYVDLLSYILIQGNKVSPSATFDESTLSNISIK